MSRSSGSWLTTGETIAAVGAVLTVVGSVLPWVSAQPTATLGGTPSGPVTALIGIGVVLVALFRPWASIDKAVVGVLGLATLLVVANALVTIGATNGAAAVSPGVGLYVVLLGGVVTVIGAGIGLVGDTASRARSTPRGS